VNAYFKTHDMSADSINGYPIPPEWWSRVYEYPWAMCYAGQSMVVADMGCGWEQRPFKDALADMCRKVYAVDAHHKVLTFTPRDNIEFVLADFTRRIEAIPDASLDRVFCISVLEELPDRLPDALVEFERCLKPGGMVVITADVVYDESKPTPYCGGISVDTLINAIDQAGLFLGEIDYDKTGAMYSEMFNLCVFHVVGVKS